MGIGERFTATSRAGSGQLAAMVKTVDFCRIQAPAYPWGPSSLTGLRPEGFEDPEHKAAICLLTNSVLRTTARLTVGRAESPTIRLRVLQ